MKSRLLYVAFLFISFGCSKGHENENVKISGPYKQAVELELMGDLDTRPIQVEHLGNGIDIGYSTTYTAPRKQEFKVMMSNGKVDLFNGFSFEATFYHYSKLLVVEYRSLDSIKSFKHYNAPISWTSNDIK